MSNTLLESMKIWCNIQVIIYQVSQDVKHRKLLFIGQFVHSAELEGMGQGEEWMWVILASCEHHFIRVHEKLVQHPSNNISIIKNCNI